MWWPSTASSSRRTRRTRFATATPSCCCPPTQEAEMRGGFFGEDLRIDLGSGGATRVALAPAIARRFIGGVGLGAWLLHQETPRGFDPLGAEAAVIFAFGPLLGTPLTTSAKYALVAKSPLTGRIGDALSSSRFAVMAKRMGVDAIVLTGCAVRPSVLLLDEDGASLEAAGDLWGHGLPVSEAAKSPLTGRIGD